MLFTVLKTKSVENHTTFEAFEFTLCNLWLIHGLYSAFLTLYSVMWG